MYVNDSQWRVLRKMIFANEYAEDKSESIW